MCFLVDLRVGLMHYENPFTRINQMQHLHACSSLMFWHLLVWEAIPENMHCFNQFIYAGHAAKSVKNRSLSLNGDRTVQQQRARVQCFLKKLTPVFLLNAVFQCISLKILLESESSI